LEVLMEDWGVSTERQGAEVLIRSRGIPERSFSYDFNDTPDLAQAFAVMAAVSKRRLTLRGLSTLKDKETNRLLALKTELERAGAEIVIGDDSLDVVQGVDVKKVPQEKFRTYHDHRMVMALSLLSIGAEGLSLLQPGHVTKSFPSYFAVLKEAGFLVEER
ncbi:MAG: hypothetical protein JNL88_13580, partial [Bacteroidia bacterium]|nr:hypothetical protein [Bacteroidia bacterium]